MCDLTYKEPKPPALPKNPKVPEPYTSFNGLTAPPQATRYASTTRGGGIPCGRRGRRSVAAGGGSRYDWLCRELAAVLHEMASALRAEGKEAEADAPK